MTFSIVGRCERTGQLGVAISSSSIAVGARCPWVRAGVGKRGGVRVIYFNRLDSGVIYRLMIYAKAVRGNIPARLLKAIKEEIEHVYHRA